MRDNASLQITPSGDREILISREFAAPRRLVFEAMTRPELLKRWLWGPDGWEMTVCESDAKSGGKFVHVWRHADGNEMKMSGVYREVVPHEKIVRTESFEFGCNAQEGEQLASMILTEDGERTKLRLTVHYPSREARDATIASGMERGLAASYGRLHELLTEPAGQLSR
jgi:uncharacterized protein YndB with AHSA1/START domain